MRREEAIRDLTHALNVVERDLPLLDKYSPNGMHSRAWRDALKMAVEALQEQEKNPDSLVKRGRWVECDWVEYDGHGECIHYPNEGRVCTNCRNTFKKEFVCNPRASYCPSCGALMED